MTVLNAIFNIIPYIWCVKIGKAQCYGELCATCYPHDKFHTLTTEFYRVLCLHTPCLQRLPEVLKIAKIDPKITMNSHTLLLF